MTLSWLSDRDDPRVKEALTRECGMCGVMAGEDCRRVSKTAVKPYWNVVHLERVTRTTQGLEKTPMKKGGRG